MLRQSSRPMSVIVMLAVALLMPATTFTPAHSAALQAPQSAIETDPSPITLIDPNGQQLTLAALHVRAAVHGPLSLTELEMTFSNPKPSVSEGRFSIVLPSGATVSRFAKEVNGRLMEGEVVERLQANRVYEQFLHQMRDPALLEQDQSNRFNARIFPIPPNGTVRVVLSYSRVLNAQDGMRRFVVPLRGLPKIADFAFRAVIAAQRGEGAAGSSIVSLPSDASAVQHEVVSFTRQAWAPDRDIEVAWKTTDQTPGSTLTAGDFYVVVQRVNGVHEGASLRDRAITMYVDTSASSADGQRHRIRAIEALIGAMPPDTPLQVVAFDQELASLSSGTAREAAATVGNLLRDRHFLGGTDLNAVLVDIVRRAGEHADEGFIVVSDGAATLGKTSANELANTLKSVPSKTLIHAVTFGTEPSALLRTITRGRGRVLSLPLTDRFDREIPQMYARLASPLGERLEVADEAAEWIYPRVIEDAHNGDEVIVFGKSRGTTPLATFRSEDGSLRAFADRAEEMDAASFAPLLEREAYHAYLNALEQRLETESDSAVRAALASERINISVNRRIMIPETTMLVLESESDYQRFGLDRHALAEILTVGTSGVERLDRAAAARVVPIQPTAKTVPAQTGQGGPATLSGVVTSDGAPVPGVTVSISSPALQGVRTAVTDVNGRYFFNSIASGEYTVRFELPGFAPVMQRLLIDARQAAAANADLRISGVAEAITVTAASPTTAALESTEVQTNVPGRVVAPVPIPANRASRDESAVAESITVSGRRRATTFTERNQANSDSARKATGWTDATTETESIQSLEKAIKETPNDRLLYTRLGELLVRSKKWTQLRALTYRWQEYDPANPEVYELLGEASRQLEDRATATRAFGSLTDLAGTEPELLQRAGLLLWRAGAVELAEVPLRASVTSRPDRVNGYRHLAFVLWQSKRYEEAARVLEGALKQQYMTRWYGDVQRVLREELGYVYRSWMRNDAAKTDAIAKRAMENSVDLKRRDALRVTMAWETDANDVDLHVADPSGVDCFYGAMQLASGLQLYQDVTQGFGPEVIRAEKMQRGTYSIGVNYFSAGPMAVSRGIVITVRDEGEGEPAVDLVPFRLVEDSRGEDVRLVGAVRMR